MDSIQVSDMTSFAIRNIVPVSILIEVCYTCNERCSHCFLEEHQSKGLSLQQYEYMFDQLVEAGTFFVIFTGGDPFTRKDFLEIVKAARKRRLSVSIFTNGTLITEEIADELKKLFIEEVHISLYSANPFIHDNITNVNGSFNRSIKAIKLLLSKGIQTRIKCPLMIETAESKNELKKLADDLGVYIQFSMIITAKNDGKQDTFKLRLNKKQIDALISDSDINSFSDTQTKLSEDIIMKSIPCETIFNGGAIDPKGDVYPCNQWRIVGGNILEKRLIDIWKNSNAFQKLRSITLKELNECSSCGLLSFCTRCPGLAHLEDGTNFGCSSIAKVHAESRKEKCIYPNQKHIFSTRDLVKGGD